MRHKKTKKTTYRLFYTRIMLYFVKKMCYSYCIKSEGLLSRIKGVKNGKN